MLRSKQKGLTIDNYIALFIQPDLSSSPESPHRPAVYGWLPGEQ